MKNQKIEKTYTMRACLVLITLLASTSIVKIAQSNGDKDIIEAEKNAFLSKENRLTVIDNNFDFGVVHQLDNTQLYEDLEKDNEFKHNLPGLKHLFEVKNETGHEIKIGGFDAECGCIQGEVVKNGLPQKLPYTVEPSEKVSVRMAFNYYDVLSGSSRAELRVKGIDMNDDLAVLVMRGLVKDGIEVSVSAINFGDVGIKNIAKSVYRDLSIKFDRRITLNLLFLPIQSFTKNKYVIAENLDAGKTIMGVKIGRDTFQMPEGFKPLPGDFTLRLRLKLREDAPVGRIKGQLGFKMLGLPMEEITRNIRVPYHGEVIGHLKAEPATILSVPRNSIGVKTRPTNIICSSPVQLKNLIINTSDPLLSAELVLLEAKPDDDGKVQLADGVEKFSLEIILSDNTQPGKFEGNITIKDKLTGERLELPVFANVPSIHKK